MGFIRLPNTWQFNLAGRSGPANWQLNYYVTFDTYSQPTSGAAAAYATALAGNFTTDSSLSSSLSTSWHFDTLTITGMDDATDAQAVAAGPALASGSNSADLLPTQVAALINWRTALRGRSYRGRTFLCGFVETVSAGDVIDSTTITRLQDYGDAVMATLTDTGRSMVVASRFSGMALVDQANGAKTFEPVPRDPGVTTPITSSAPDAYWKTQRRRALTG